jgi:hypothetical protein
MIVRRRIVRDLGTLAGIAVILAGVVGLNIYMRLDGLKQKYDRIRRGVEAQRMKAGVELLDWELLRKTKGSLRSGPKFDEALLARVTDGRSVNLVGFMTPIDQFKDIDRFMLLPLPIQCYFCEMPPIRDVMLVRMAKGEEVASIYEDPVMISGELCLNEGPRQKFFYSIEGAALQSGRTGANMKPRSISKEHRQQGYTLGGELLEGTEKHTPQSGPMPDQPESGPAESPLQKTAAAK